MGRLKKAEYIPALLVLVCLMCLCLSGCGQRSGRSFYLLSGQPDPLADLVLSADPRLHPVPQAKECNPLPDVLEGSVLEGYDIQYRAALLEGVELSWQPMCTATAVIAYDPARVSAPPRSWRELTECGQPVSWLFRNQLEEQLLYGALSYGLTGPQFSRLPALELLRTLREQGNLSAHEPQAPVLVLLDTQAAALIGEGRSLSLAVPEDGTLSFDLGLLSGKPLGAPPRAQALLGAGLRLPDGRCTYPAYPDDYSAAARVADVSHFLSETQNVTKEVRRFVLGTRLYTSADLREMIMMCLTSMILTLVWIGTVDRRSVRPQLKALMLSIGIQTVLWILLSLVKQQLPTLSPASRYCWYGYYIFQLGMPLTLLWLTAVINDTSEKLRFPRPIRWLFLLGGALLFMVLTNDLHQLVFSFDFSGNWSDIYTYGPVYYMIYAFCFLVFFVAVGLLIWKSIRSPQRWRWIFPVLSAVLIVSYTLGYALQWSFARESNYTLTFCTLALVFVEAALHTGLIPVNTQYRRIFTSSPLAMQLLNTRGDVVLAGLTATPLPPEIRQRLSSRPAVSISRDGHSLLLGRAVRGGTLVWEEDRSALDALREEMCVTTRRLEGANALLRQEDHIRRKKLELSARAELFESLEEEISERTEELSEAIDRLPSSPSHRRQIAYITLLLCYIKRRCNLFFLAREAPDMPAEELSMYLDELCEFARYAGVGALFRCSLEGRLSVRLATLCYDFSLSLLSWSAQGSRASLLGELTRQKDGLWVRFLCSERPVSLPFTRGFSDHVRELGGGVELRELDEETGIYLLLPEGGEDRV